MAEEMARGREMERAHRFPRTDCVNQETLARTLYGGPSVMHLGQDEVCPCR